MQESYKVEHKEKYYISVEKVWSNIKKWWPVVAVFVMLAVVAMVMYSKKEYQQAIATYEMQKNTVTEQPEAGNEYANITELENAYYDLTQIAVCLEQVASVSESDVLEQVNAHAIKVSQAIELSLQGNNTIPRSELGEWILDAKTQLKEAVSGLAVKKGKEIVLRLDLTDESNYAFALRELRALVSKREAWNSWIEKEEQVYVVPDVNNLPESEKKLGVDERQIRIIISSDKDVIETTAEKVCSFLNERGANALFSGHVVAYENEGTLRQFLPTFYNQVRTQSVNIAYRYIAAEQTADNAVVIMEPTYRLISRGSIIRFAMFVCVGGAFLFVMIMLDHKVRTEEEFYDLFGESPIAVVKKKNHTSTVEQLSHQLAYLAKEKNWQKVGLLYSGKSLDSKKTVDAVTNYLLKEKLAVKSVSREEARELYGYDEVIVFYDAEYITEKMLNQIITELHQVSTKIEGMVIC